MSVLTRSSQVSPLEASYADEGGGRAGGPAGGLYGFDYGYRRTPGLVGRERPIALWERPPAVRRRPHYFWRRLAALFAVGVLGAVTWSTAQHLIAGAAVPLTVASCSHGLVPVPSGAAGGGGGGTCGLSYVARPGDTIWSVAVEFSHGGDPRPLEDELEAQIGGGVLQPGQVLVVPR